MHNFKSIMWYKKKSKKELNEIEEPKLVNYGMSIEMIQYSILITKPIWYGFLSWSKVFIVIRIYLKEIPDYIENNYISKIIVKIVKFCICYMLINLMAY